MTEADFIGKDPFADIMVINFHMSCVSMKNQIEYKWYGGFVITPYKGCGFKWYSKISEKYLEPRKLYGRVGKGAILGFKWSFM